MTKTEPQARPGVAVGTIETVAVGAIETIDDLEQSPLESVRNFVDTLNSMFPDVRDDGPRRQVIDAAFKMVEKLVGTSNEASRNIVLATEHALDEFDRTRR